ncbi:MAG TPA: SpoVR family protein, partial [Rhodocyclaceae bacterium]|nr:SpoVR family protein [Rhodocyclaceae bacterium]
MSKKKIRPIAEGSDWTVEAIERYDVEIGRVAKHYELDCYRHQLEIITAEQMMDAYASIGMPVYYHHWSFGKHFLETENRYKRGQMGLAYEIVINSDPCIAYLMEENTLTMQALVIAHAAYGHNSFFKGNHLFKQWTSADAIIDYLVFAKNYIAQCEERHGFEAVERLVDACHALMNLGVDRYKRSPRLSLEKETLRQKERETYLQAQINDLWRTLPKQEVVEMQEEERRFPEEPEENLLYFVEKNAPLLEPWQREVVRIV